MKKAIIYLAAISISLSSCIKEGKQFTDMTGNKIEPKIYYPSNSDPDYLNAPNGVKFWGSHIDFVKEQHFFVPQKFDLNVTVPITYPAVPTHIFLKLYAVDLEGKEMFLGEQSYKLDYDVLPFNDVIFGDLNNLTIQNTTIHNKYFYIPSFGDGIVYDKVFFKP